MRSAKRVVLLSILALVLLWPGTGMSKNIKVGAAINLTGPASTWGQFHAKGQQDYFRYVNEVKGGVAGHKIEMILVDTAYKVPEAVAAVRKFAVQDQVDMIATWGAGEGLAAKPIIQKYQIPTINYSTSLGDSRTADRIHVPSLRELPPGLRGRPRLHSRHPQRQGTAEGGTADLQQRLRPLHPQTEPGICRETEHQHRRH